MKKLILAIGIIAILLITAGLYYWYATRDQRAVKKLLNNMIQLCNKVPSKVPHHGILKYSGIDTIFADPVRVYSEYPEFDQKLPRNKLRTVLILLHRGVVKMDVETGNLHISVSENRADFSFDASVKMVYKDRMFREEVVAVKGRAEKQEGRWFVTELAVELVVK
ncbi:MAG: hypothetical protein IKA71_04605 [Lentisphaeria bacterium]|nr:hypothetical protein [Lentisphaeria bacterium]